MLKTSDTANGELNEAGTSAIMYQGGRRLNECKNFLGPYISQIAAEYISLIIGIKLVRRSVRTLRNKVITIHIKS